MSSTNFLWCEAYRPKTVKDCVLPESLKKTFQQYVDSKEIPNLILTGTSGVGKTTVARAMCEETGIDYILINGSVESGIDTLRVKILSYASSMSLMGGRKVIIVDEADNLSQAAQLGFRGVIEEVSDNCSFIFTCNYLNRIEKAIHSRCAVIQFKLSVKDKEEMMRQFYKVVVRILDSPGITEHVAYKEVVVQKLVVKHFPDYRRILNELQRYSASGTIDEGILSDLSNVKIDELIGYLKAKNFRSVRQWVGANSDSDSGLLFRNIYDRMFEIVTPQTVPVLVVLLGRYQFWASSVADQEVNTMAFLTELMIEAEFK